MGHAAGDELLVAVTDRIGALVRDGDMVARLGGDEFAVLTHDQPDLRRARSMADRLVRELRAPYHLAAGSITISASIGIAGAHDAIDGAADMVRNADVAMYMAKAGGKSGFAIFDPGMHQAIRERHELAIELQHAVELDQLQLRYQPIMDLRTGTPGRRRGARPLAPPGARPDRARPVHRDRGGARLHPADRALGHARGVPPGRRVDRGRRPRRPTCSSGSTSRRARSARPGSWTACAPRSRTWAWRRSASSWS